MYAPGSINHFNIPTGFWSLAFANATSIAALALARRAWPRIDWGRRARWFYLRLARRLVWSLFSVTTTILQGQGVAFLVVGFAGTQGYAPIAAMLIQLAISRSREFAADEGGAKLTL